ncbi:GTPase required for pre-60S ribosomal subunit nuclear export and maturation [Coniosporium tulheliwenetii]|uniref:GTPase required for pre-60S ribosomal subunit nuclear export and maturation n=1 Tax=Coniosporium tulheliwenetii TaxID=3383036 RepID=A0ACC2Z8G7_9PEZI|nr:GTPase required for pre-60S ribosomal subunit nuclear export and maturation [Cladosporium sp. JES 115]
MGSFKKEKARKERDGTTGDGMANVRMKGENFYRDAKKVKKLNILKEGKAQRNASGKITKAASYQSRDKPKALIEPNRKWFGNTRVISQDALNAFRGAVEAQQADPYSYLLRQNKLPMSLIRDTTTKNGVKQHAAKMTVETSPFSDTFGPKAQRKRVKLGVSSLQDLAGESVKMHDDYLDRLEQAKLLSGNSGASAQEDDGTNADGTLTSAIEPVFSKGQSKRIWNELYKVIDSSDVILHVLDARDPEGTRCRSVEKYIATEAPHKHLVFILNKVDLVPSKVAAAWVRHLSTQHPTLAFHASITNSFGKGSLIALLRQFSSLHSERKQISCGLIGKVCSVAPQPGETKVWQYITLMKRIYLIDCPGIVPPQQNDSPEELLLRGTVRVEKLEEPHQYIEAVLRKVKKQHVERTYEIKGWGSTLEFLEMLARKGGRLLKGGEADLDGVAKMVLNDFCRGRLPWFTPPPVAERDGEGFARGKTAGAEDEEDASSDGISDESSEAEVEIEAVEDGLNAATVVAEQDETDKLSENSGTIDEAPSAGKSRKRRRKQ